MILQELKKGEAITLEIVWGTNSYEMSVNVLAVKGDGIIISPLIFNGITLDLGRGKNMDMSYNIYTIVDSRRIGWKNVQIELVTLTNKEQAYYVRTFLFAKRSSDGERRGEERTIIKANGYLVEENRKIPIKIHDISSNGISFHISKGAYLYLDQPVAIEVVDKVKGKDMNILINCKVARKASGDMDEIVGCSIGKGTKALLFYLFSKRLAMTRA